MGQTLAFQRTLQPIRSFHVPLYWIIACAFTLVLPTSHALAGIAYTWQGTNVGNDWGVPSNWSGGVSVPAASDTASFTPSSTSGQTVFVDSAGTDSIGTMIFNANGAGGTTIAKSLSSSAAALIINNGGTAYISITGGTATIDAPMTISSSDLIITTTANSTLTISGSINALVPNSGSTLIEKTGAGVLNLSGGLFQTSSSFTANRDLYVHQGNVVVTSSNLYLTGILTGDNNADTNVSVTNTAFTMDGSADNWNGLNIGYNANATALYDMHGGSYVANRGGVFMALSGGHVRALLTMDNNATMNLTSSQIYMGDNGGHGGGAAQFTMHNGSLTLDSSSYIELGVAGGDNVFNQMGGTVFSPRNTGNTANNGAPSALTLQYRMNKSDNYGIYNLGGGTLTAGAIVSGDGTPNLSQNNAYLNFHGGTLIPNTDESNFIRTTISGSNAAFAAPHLEVYSEGAFINTNGHNITINDPFLAPTGNGVAGGTIAIASVNQGSGYAATPIVIITDATGGTAGTNGNNFTSATAVANMVDDGTGNGTYKIASITITNPGVNLSSAAIVISGGSPVTPAVMPALTLAANVSGGLTKSGNGTLILGATGSTYGGITSITAGTLTAAGANVLSPNSTISLQAEGTVLDIQAGPQTVGGLDISDGQIKMTLGDLFTVSGFADLSGGTLNLYGTTSSTLQLMSFVGGHSGTFPYVNGIPNGYSLLYTANELDLALPFVAPPPPTWSATTSGSWNTAANWTPANVPNAQGAIVLMGSAPTTPTTVTLDSDQMVGSLTFDNTAGYTLAVGTSGSLTLSNTGGLPGSISVLSGEHIIAAPLILAGTSSVITLTGNGKLDIPSNISGTGTLTLSSSDTSGILTLSGTNSYGGGTIVSSGFLVLDSYAALPVGKYLTIGSGAPGATFAPPAATGSPAPAVNVVPVPEPGTLALLCAALLAGFGLWRRRCN